jgi:hypothetical protein
LNIVEIILTDYVNNKAFMTTLQHRFTLLQTSIPDECLHIICYFAFFYHPYIKQNLGRSGKSSRLGELIEKTTLLDELHTRAVIARKNTYEHHRKYRFSPLEASWIEKMRPELWKRK